MAHRPGDDLAHFRLVEEIGAGAMGTVWRATDTTLDRDVAVKVLPAALAEDPQLIARFEREAKLLASLHHANLAAVYGVHDANGTRFLTMELVPGEDLSERLKRGPLRVDEAIPVACRIADAVEAAHERGVVHRDLKPANVRLAPGGRVKVLDFGLAKSVPTGTSIREGSDPPSDLAATTAGLVLGTVPYMSPEQARGRPVDTRSDIWSYGCVLWECLTGERPFRGETVSDLIAAILHHEPDWAQLPAGTPPAVERVLRRCLAKDRRKRLHHVADARIELEGALVDDSEGGAISSGHAPVRVRPLAGALALSLIAVAVLLVLLLSRKSTDSPASVADPFASARITKLTSYPGAEFDAAISPDGRFVAYVSDHDGPFDVYVGQIGTGAYHRLTNEAERSRGGDVRARVRNVGFLGSGQAIWLGGGFTERGMRQSDSLLGGPFSTLLDDDAVNVAWTADGSRMVYHHGTDGDPVYVAERTGANRELVLSSEPGFHQHYPMWSRDGEWIFIVRGWETTGDVDLWRVRRNGRDLERLTEGKRKVAYPTPLDDRTLLYVAQEADGAGPWLWALDLETKVSRRAAFGMERYSSVSASADGRRIVATIVNPEAGLWTVPILEREATEDDVEPYALPSVRALAPRARGEDLFFLSSRVSGDGLWKERDGEVSEIWKGRDGVLLEPAAISPDGARVVVTVRRGSEVRLYVMNADGTVPVELTDAVSPRGAADWSPDGNWLVFGGTAEGVNGLYKIRADGSRWERVVEGEALNPVWSADGKMIVYAGRQVMGFTPLVAVDPEGRPLDLPRVEVYRGGEPFRFLPDGSGLVYMVGGQPGKDFNLLDIETGKTRRLTRLDLKATMRSFDITPDGKRIVFDRLSENSDIVLIER